MGPEKGITLGKYLEEYEQLKNRIRHLESAIRTLKECAGNHFTEAIGAVQDKLNKAKQELKEFYDTPIFKHRY